VITKFNPRAQYQGGVVHLKVPPGVSCLQLPCAPQPVTLEPGSVVTVDTATAGTLRQAGWAVVSEGELPR